MTIDIPLLGIERAGGRRLDGLPQVWARSRIANLYDRWLIDQGSHLKEQIRQTALSYGIMSPYTSFIAVDSTRRTEGEYGVTVQQPVRVPDGVRYETTVPN